MVRSLDGCPLGRPAQDFRTRAQPHLLVWLEKDALGYMRSDGQIVEIFWDFLHPTLTVMREYVSVEFKVQYFVASTRPAGNIDIQHYRYSNPQRYLWVVSE